MFYIMNMCDILFSKAIYVKIICCFKTSFFLSSYPKNVKECLYNICKFKHSSY